MAGDPSIGDNGRFPRPLHTNPATRQARAPGDRWRAILLFGMPGSGKGTQGRALGSMPGYLHLSSGEIFRQLHRLGTYGKQVDAYLQEGKLVPDELTVTIWRNHMRLIQRKHAFEPSEQILILDGIPRTYRQAQLLQGDLDVLRIFYLQLESDEEAVSRIVARSTQEDRADDNSLAVIRDRVATFHRQTADVLRFYDPCLTCHIDASGTPMHVLRELSGEVCELIGQPA